MREGKISEGSILICIPHRTTVLETILQMSLFEKRKIGTLWTEEQYQTGDVETKLHWLINKTQMHIGITITKKLLLAYMLKEV